MWKLLAVMWIKSRILIGKLFIFQGFSEIDRHLKKLYLNFDKIFWIYNFLDLDSVI